MRLIARAPLRVDFAGGWTDVPVYAEAEGGAVLNAAITIYVHGSIARPGLRRDAGELSWEVVGGPGESAGLGAPGGPPRPLRAGAAPTRSVPSKFAPTGLLQGLRGNRSYLEYRLDAPTGAGLGASAAQTVLWTALVKTSIANVTTREEIAAIACRVSASLGIVGGKQDEYASALGGILFLTFGETVQVERLRLPSSVVQGFRSRLVLVYSGTSRLSSSIHEHVWSQYRAGDQTVREALASLKRIAVESRSALLGGDLEAIGALLSENWENQKALHPTITNPDLDALFDWAMQRGAIGGKACGAGGGGCLMFLAREGEEERLRAALRSHKLQPLDFDFDTYGVHVGRG